MKLSKRKITATKVSKTFYRFKVKAFKKLAPHSTSMTMLEYQLMVKVREHLFSKLNAMHTHIKKQPYTPTPIAQLYGKER